MEDGGGWAVLLQQCHPNSAGSLVIAKRTSEIPIVFVVSLVLSVTPKLREMSKVGLYR